jgi:hypothetical protein
MTEPTETEAAALRDLLASARLRLQDVVDSLGTGDPTSTSLPITPKLWDNNSSCNSGCTCKAATT